jgi:hypothetical protein
VSSMAGLDRCLKSRPHRDSIIHNRYLKVVRLSTLRTGRLYPPGNIPGTHFCYRLSRPQDHSATGRIMSMKNSNDIIGSRTRDLPACSAVPKPTAPPLAPHIQVVNATYESNIVVLSSFNYGLLRFPLSTPI